MHLPAIRNGCIVITVLLLWSPGFSQSGGDRICGMWYTEGCKAAFDFFRSGHEYQARLIALQKPNLIDSLNPIDSLKNRRLNGAVTIYGLQYDTTERRWYNGKVYNPENGRTYSCNCSINKDSSLMFRGFIGMSLLGESQVWIRGPCTESRKH